MTKSGGTFPTPPNLKSLGHPKKTFGVIFRIDPNGFTNYDVLHSFVGGADDGATTDHGYLVLDANNVLYGMTTFGGASNRGRDFQHPYRWKLFHFAAHLRRRLRVMAPIHTARWGVH